MNHHDFRSNSGIQIFNLANELDRLGVGCRVVVPGDPSTVQLIGTPHFEVLEHRHARRARGALVHAWTPRENVRAVTEKIVGRGRLPYVVHLEDNEDLVSANDHERSEYRSFLERSAGVTVVNEKLFEFKPDGIPGEVIWPAYEEHLFRPQPADGSLRALLGLAPANHVVVYHGNSHSLNAAELRSLYLAIAIVNLRGTPVTLVRLGDDYVDFLGDDAGRVERYVVQVPYTRRSEVPRYLALADVYVQPGRPDAFNDYRFPSKLPEFFAMGKPVILPRSNLGLHLRDGENCLLLETGEPEELAELLQSCLLDPALCERLGAAALAFAEASFSWPRSAMHLKSFYESVLR